MDESRAEVERRFYNRLTCIKLAMEILETRTEASGYQRKLARTVIEAADSLAAERIHERQRAGAPAQSVLPRPPQRVGAWPPLATRGVLAGLVWRLIVPLGWRTLHGLGRQLLQPRLIGASALGRPWTDLRLKPRRRRA